MQFTKLRLTGFKSFVDPTELVIAPGLTGVVGPNGCGKSNLLEALRWVMGENRPSAMRGGGMEDVIFAGCQTRPARASAEVAMVIDNAQRLAPAAFNHEDMLEVVRRITRDIGSAYRMNGKEVRARDVQMLFADASSGAHSPSLVRQGQIGELISAKPKARRRILEEAAGISGLYARRHEAELKLNAAETNLARVEDVIQQLDGRLSTLERQARQARRYREISAQLRDAEAMLLFLRWQVADAERLRADTALTEAVRLTAEATGKASAAARAREVADGALAPLREENMVASAVLSRLAVERDQLTEQETRARQQIEALAARARQLAADLERETALAHDAGETVARLDAEEAKLREQHEGHDAALAAAAEAARTAGETLSQRETQLDRLTEEAARLAARAAAANRRLEEAQAQVVKLEGEIELASRAVASAGDEIFRAEKALEHAKAEAAKAQSDAVAAEAACTEAEAARAEAQSAEAAARAAQSEAAGEASAIRAEAQALERLLKREEGKGTQLLDQVRAARGYEAALGAALGDDLRAGVVDRGTGWMQLPPLDTTQALPDGAEPLAPQIGGPDVLARRLSQVGVVAPEDGPRLQPLLKPGQRLVSREGDLWRWDGYGVSAADTPSAAALRLQQKNRLDELTAALTKAEAAAQATAEAHAGARKALDAAAARDQETRQLRRKADEAAAAAARTLSKAEADLDMRRGRLEAQTASLEGRRADLEAGQAALKEAEEAVDALDDVAAARRAVEIQRGEVDLARTAMLSARTRSDEIRREGAAREKRLADIARERTGWQDRLANAGTRTDELRARAERTEAERKEAAKLPEELAGKRAGLASQIEAAETRQKKAADALAEGENALRAAEQAERDCERAASTARETRARAEAVLEAAAEKAGTAAEIIAEELETTPAALAEGYSGQDLPGLDTLETEAAKLRRQRDSLGAVNLRAEEDAEEIATERGTLAEEKADLDAAIAELRKGIAELNREGRTRLLDAFETVNQNFSILFKHLFGGGEARLVMVESDDPLEAGLEIMCMPPGKKLATLSLLSGGEQTLTALSLIFAVFLSNPAPICVLDEVDAPLDDANVGRFCDLLDEMTRRTETRFLIITHNAVTMSRMDRLFGVTMIEKGVSQLVSVDLARAAEMAAE